MTIALNFIALPSEQGAGAFHYIHNILSVMGEYKIHNTHFIVYKQRQISEEYLGIPKNIEVEYINVPTLGDGWKRILFEQTLFYRYIKPCDVFYSYCTSIPLLVRAKRVFTLHDVYYITNPERYGWLQRLYLKITTRIYAYFVDEILTVSKYSKQQIETYIPKAIGKVRLTYNIIPAKKKMEQLVAIDKKPYFLFVGSIQPSKNITRMVDGFKKFNTAGNYHLYIVGQVLHSSDSIIEHIKKVENVSYLGYRSDAEVAYLYHHTEAVVLLSLCEGFGIPPLEGFYYNKPALVANATSLPEVVGDAGEIVNPLDIDAIAKGFENVITKKEEFIKHIPLQISKFNKNISCEVWMKSLLINFEQ
jgi:glycosyltransferase involved in cell wall biosynthesis